MQIINIEFNVFKLLRIKLKQTNKQQQKKAKEFMFHKNLCTLHIECWAFFVFEISLTYEVINAPKVSILYLLKDILIKTW